jgi:hypothetical protein
MSLTYLESEHPAPGKTSSDTDTFEGTFAELVPDERHVEMSSSTPLTPSTPASS